MRMNRIILFSTLCFAFFLSCTDRDDAVDMVNIRIKNSTEQFFTEVQIAQRDTVYQNIAAGDYSAYLAFDTAFKTPPLTILTDSMRLNYLPSEVLSDSLPIGFYTYDISVDTENRVGLIFRIDE